MIPDVVKPIAHRIRDGIFRVLDVTDTLLGRKDPLTPPRRLMNVGSDSIFRNDFNAIGNVLFGYLVDIGGLKPDDRVLDVGCGVGRMAIPLTRYLRGTYDGFDIVKPSIDYCQRVISARHPNFRFTHAELFNTHYTPGIPAQPHEFTFPYADGAFTFVFLTSVFTHMRAREMERYLAEIHRVLAPGGRCFATYFLLNDETDALIRQAPGALTFRHPMAHGRANSADNPDAAFAYDEAYVRRLHASTGLRILGPVHHGSWPGRHSDSGYQDIVVSEKITAREPAAIG